MSGDDALESVDGADGGLRAAAAVSQLRRRRRVLVLLRTRAFSSPRLLGGEERLRREGHQDGLERDPRWAHER